MYIAIPKENLNNETRVAATPATVKELIKVGLNVHIQSNAGLESHISNSDYESAGAKIVDSKDELFSKADIVAKVLSPTLDQIVQMRPKH